MKHLNIVLKSQKDFNQLYEIISSEKKLDSVDVDVSKLSFITPFMVLMMTQFFVFMIKSGSRTGSIIIDEKNKSNQYLKDIGILEFCNSNYSQPNTLHEISIQTAMPIRWITTETMNSYITLAEKYFKTFCKSKDLTMLNLCIAELINNIYDHSNSEIGAYVFCQFFPKLNKITISASDLGIGIPNKVNRYLKSKNMPELSPKDCVIWAITENNSTESTPRNRGKGLFNIMNFVNMNKSGIRIYTEKVVLNGSGNSKAFYYNTLNYFVGTIVEVDILIDNLIPAEEDYISFEF